MNITHNKIIFFHLLSEFLTLLFRVNINETLIHINITKNLDQIFKFLLIVLTRDVKLLNTLKCQILLFDKNFRGIIHDIFGKFNDLVTDSSGEEADLTIRWD